MLNGITLVIFDKMSQLARSRGKNCPNSALCIARRETNCGARKALGKRESSRWHLFMGGGKNKWFFGGKVNIWTGSVAVGGIYGRVGVCCRVFRHQQSWSHGLDTMRGTAEQILKLTIVHTADCTNADCRLQTGAVHLHTACCFVCCRTMHCLQHKMLTNVSINTNIPPFYWGLHIALWAPTKL